MLGKVVEAFLILILAIEVFAILLSMASIIKGVSITVNQVDNIYTTRICLGNVAPMNVGIYAGSSGMTLHPGQYGCLIVNSTQLLSNITLAIGLLNVTLSVGYAK